MAKADTVYSLFGMKTPQEVAAERLQKQQEYIMSQRDGFSQSGAAIGVGLARLFGGPSEEMQRAEAGQKAIQMARQDVAQTRAQAEDAKREQMLSIDAEIARESAGQVGRLPQEPEPSADQKTVENYMKNAELYEAMAARLENAGFQAEAEAARNSATEQRLGALDYRSSLIDMRAKSADIAKTEAEIKASGIVGEINFGNKASVVDAAERLARAGNYSEAIRLYDIVTQDPGSAQRDIEYFANEVIRCDVNDPECRNQAMEMAIDYKRTDPTQRPAYESATTQLEERYNDARNAKSQLMRSSRSLALLDQGRVNVGTFAKTRQGAEKFYQAVLGSMGLNVGEDDVVARTDALLANTGALAAQRLGSGDFGAGTGISERDLLEARRIEGAAESLTPETMKFILRMNEQLNRKKIEDYNTSLDRFSPQFWASSPYLGKEAYTVDAPAPYTGDLASRAEATAQDSEGNVIYYVEGNWVDGSGQPIQGN